MFDVLSTFERMEPARLPPGDVTVRVEYSSLNFKDTLAVTGRGAIVRKWPLVPGIDLAGVVECSDDPRWQQATAWSSTAGAWARPIGAASRS